MAWQGRAEGGTESHRRLRPQAEATGCPSPEYLHVIFLRLLSQPEAILL